MTFQIVTCLILSMVSSRGDMINVNHLRYLKTLDGGCSVVQYYNPPFIQSDWTCKQVEKSIIDAIKTGCNKV